MKKRIYLIGNAHLDPVWQWRWTEGIAAVKQTVRSALDRMRETDGFIFTSSQAVAYRWLSECAPELLEEVRARVAEGRFVLCGGQYVQPDCNTPSGESFARHSLYSQRIFKRLLGVTAKTAYNVDSFGHNAMLPQIFKKSGMARYVMMRPGQHEKEMEENVFLWRSPDGTEIPVFRITESYCGNYETEEDMTKRIETFCRAANEDLESTMVFYGVGNHGGGPTKKNLAIIKALQEKYRGESEILFASPDDFFRDLSASGAVLPVVEDDLQHHASGCYSAVSELKRLNRRGEADLYFAEAFASIAHRKLGLVYPGARLEEAWENLLFNQFHDIMGGCSIEKAYEDAFAFAGESLASAAKITAMATQGLSWAVDTMELPGTPAIVFNPHPWKLRVPVRVNYRVDSIRTTDGKDVPFQTVHSQAESCMWRGDALFIAEIPPMGYATYLIGDRTESAISGTYIAGGETKEFPSPVKATPAPELQTANDCPGPVLENEYLRAEFIPYNGFVASVKDKETGEELLAAPGAVPVVVDEYRHDTWSHAKNFFDRDIAVFSDAKCTVTENGPVRATVKVESRYNDSKLTQYFSLAAGEKMLRVRAVCDWREKHKMLKISWPCDVGTPAAAEYEIPFGHFARPADGEEENGHRYVAVRGEKRSMAMLNDGKYSFSIQGGDLRLTVLRSPIYGDHGGPRTAESEFTEQGISEFRYSMVPGPATPDYAALERRAAELNCPPVLVCENNHKGFLPPEDSFGSVDADNVDVTAFKRAEDGNGWIVRAYETAGREETETVLRLPLLAKEIPLRFGKFEIRTLLIPDGEEEAREVMLTEWDYGE